MSLNTNDKSSRRIHGPEPNELWPMTPQTRRTDIYIYAHNSTGNATYSLLQNILQWNITWHGKFVCNDMPLHTDGNRHKQKCITSSGITDIARWGINYLLHSAPPPQPHHTHRRYTHHGKVKAVPQTRRGRHCGRGRGRHRWPPGCSNETGSPPPGWAGSGTAPSHAAAAPSSSCRNTTTTIPVVSYKTDSSSRTAHMPNSIINPWLCEAGINKLFSRNTVSPKDLATSLHA